MHRRWWLLPEGASAPTADTLAARIVAAESATSRERVARTLGLAVPPPPSEPHTLELMVKRKGAKYGRAAMDARSANGRSVGVMHVPHDLAVTDLLRAITIYGHNYIRPQLYTAITIYGHNYIGDGPAAVDPRQVRGRRRAARGP